VGAVEILRGSRACSLVSLVLAWRWGVQPGLHAERDFGRTPVWV